jgi:DNA-binding CsgD family transcriptional regulator
MTDTDIRLQHIIDSFVSSKNLTKRERELLYYWLRDYDYKTIGTELYISEKTVRKHLENINLKLGTHSRSGILLSIIVHLTELSFN